MRNFFVHCLKSCVNVKGFLLLIMISRFLFTLPGRTGDCVAVPNDDGGLAQVRTLRGTNHLVVVSETGDFALLFTCTNAALYE